MNLYQCVFEMCFLVFRGYRILVNKSCGPVESGLRRVLVATLVLATSGRPSDVIGAISLCVLDIARAVACLAARMLSANLAI